MKVLLVHDLNPLARAGGVENNSRDLLRAWSEDGHHCRLAFPNSPGVIVKNPDVFAPIGKADDLRKEIDATDVVILIATFTARPLSLAAANIMQEKKRKFIAYFYSTFANRNFSGRWSRLNHLEQDLADIELRRLANSKEAILATLSDSLASEMKEYLLEQNTKQIKIIPPGIDWTKAPKPKIGPSLKQPVFMFVGRISLGKGVFLLIEALKLLLDQHPKKTRDLRVQFIGSGEAESDLKQLAAALELQDRVDFLGPLPNHEVLNKLASAYATVLPSFTESFGMVLVESLGMGTPAIATNREGMREVLGEGNLGLLFPAGNAAELADSMRQLLNEKNYRNFSNQETVGLIRNKYAIKKQAKMIIELAGASL